VPAGDYDAAIVCTPDEAKPALLERLVDLGKHVLVEKPLTLSDDGDYGRLQELARRRGVLCRTAYNHRYEPHFVRLRALVASGALGRLYYCRLFYGNGTAALVRGSPWRDSGSGVIADLGSHLLDSARWWFGDLGEDFRLDACDRFENRAPDHAVFSGGGAPLRLQGEVSLVSWRNHFTCDLYGEEGSAHISSLCKWGPSVFVARRRLRPSGRPEEQTVTEPEGDPTWALEWADFKQAVGAGAPTDLSADRWLHRVLGRLAAAAAP
jgi:scyllo-inositol 2-dehydrogenase (NADP+)